MTQANTQARALPFGTEVRVTVAEGAMARRGVVLDSFVEGGHLWYTVELHPTESQYGRTITARAGIVFPA